MGRKVTRQESWLYPLAASSLETAHWTQLYNHNVGNVTGGKAWYTNPHVGTSLKFRSFPSLVAGARGMLGALKAHGALDAADAGDRAAFQTAMNAYLGTGQTYPDLSGVIAQLRGTIVDVS